MSNCIRIHRWLACLLFVVFASGCSTQTESVYPARPIKVVVPFGAGGGSDTFARLIQNAVESEQLLPQPLVIVNVPGAGGTIGSRRVKNARPDGYTLLLLHEGILTAKHSGQAAYGPEAFAPIAGSSNATQVIAVADSSPFRDLKAMMSRAAEDPDSLVFAANVGAPSYFAGLMLEAECDGAAFRYTQSGGGAKRFAALQGGHVDVSSFSIAEYVQFQPSGIRALALLGDGRNESLPELATAREQGFDVVSQNMQFWWAPQGTPDARIKTIADAIERAMQTSEVEAKLSEMRMATTTLRGDALKDELRRRESKIASVAPSQVFLLPDFPKWAMVALMGCIVLAGVRHLVRSSKAAAKEREQSSTQLPEREWGSLGAMSVALVAYVVTLQSRTLGFQFATVIFTLVASLLLVASKREAITSVRILLSISCVALVMGIAIHRLFTQVLVVDLP